MQVDFVERLLLDYPRSHHRWIGLEIERILTSSTGRPLRYEPDLRPLLEYLVQEKAWKRDYESEGKLLGISRSLSAISLEPGSQFEVSLAPRQTISEIEKLHASVDAEIFEWPQTYDWKILELAVNPWERAEDVNLLPSPRYGLMDQYFQSIPEGRGRDMMRLTAGLQINLDFESEAEGVELLRAAFFLAPYASALAANSPLFQSHKSSRLSERHFIWKRTDPLRSGFPSFVFDHAFQLRHWADYVSRSPLMYAFDQDGKVFNPQGKRLVDFDDALASKNALSALRQIFAEVRLKPCCVEIRYLDQVPLRDRLGLTAFVVGLLYDDQNRGNLARRSLDGGARKLADLMERAAVSGFQDAEIYDELCKLVILAREGLGRRGFGEESYLEVIEERIERRLTPAEDFLKLHPDFFSESRVSK